MNNIDQYIDIGKPIFPMHYENIFKTFTTECDHQGICLCIVNHLRGMTHNTSRLIVYISILLLVFLYVSIILHFLNKLCQITSFVYIYM